jgi:uncharacterized membrane protein YphA (DoxX/SURF4 family)
MSAGKDYRRTGGWTPLVLRVAVAGVLCYAGLRNLDSPTRTDWVEPSGASPVQPAPAVAPVGSEPLNQAEDAAAAAATALGHADPAEAAALVNESRVTLSASASWPWLVGVTELIVAGFLLVGFLTRLTALALLGGVAYAATGASWIAETASWWARPVTMYADNSMAMLLLGAIALTLLASGCGHAGLDRLLFRRKRLAGDEDVAAEAPA